MKGFHWSSFFLALVGIVSSEYNPLQGKHLFVGAQHTAVHLYVMRNASGHILKLHGVGANTLAALSQRFKFTYSILQVNDTFLEKQSDGSPGMAYYMRNGRCDVIVGTILMATSRLGLMDFAEGYAYTTIDVVIPMPESTANIAAITEPFQLPVWIALISFIPITALVFHFSTRPIASSMLDRKREAKPSSLVTTCQTIIIILQILLNQGGRFSATSRNAVLFVLGCWCLGTFVLVCAYNSVLISHILRSNAELLVVSLRDLADKPHVPFAIDKGRALDTVLSTAKDGPYKQLGDRLKSNPKSRCTKKEHCVNLVKYERYAYIQAAFGALTVLDEDFKATNKCHLAIARKSNPSPGITAWALPWKNPHTKSFTKGFMELHQGGLIDFWTRKEEQKNKNANFCLNKADKKRKSEIFENKTKITLKNFSGAFSVLTSGCILSFLCFVGEILYSLIMSFINIKLNTFRNVMHAQENS